MFTFNINKTEIISKFFTDGIYLSDVNAYEEIGDGLTNLIFI